MTYATSFRIDAVRLLSQEEINTILADLHRKAKRSMTAKLNLTIFRLSTFAGLRASEIAGLCIGDLILETKQPFIRVRGEIAKGGKTRITPIWSDSAVEDLKDWRGVRRANGGKENDMFIASTHRDSTVKRLNRSQIRKHFITAVKVLGRERQGTQTTHSGRHLFCTMAIAKGVPIVEVKEAMGHSSLSITSIYAGKFRSGKSLQYSID
jgi:integrase